jgi:hypothetical protein
MPLNGPALRVSHPRTIVTVVPAPPNLLVKTPGKVIASAVFPAIAYVAMVASGPDSTAARNGIGDPSGRVADMLAQSLSRRYSLETKPRMVGRAPEAAGADLVMTVRTQAWQVSYFPDDWASYQVLYDARLELVDARDGRVIAAGDCHSGNGDRRSAPTYEELRADNWAALGPLLADVADYCAEQYRSQLFNIFTP